jgi:hypothetical protein
LPTIAKIARIFTAGVFNTVMADIQLQTGLASNVETMPAYIAFAVLSLLSKLPYPLIRIDLLALAESMPAIRN